MARVHVPKRCDYCGKVSGFVGWRCAACERVDRRAKPHSVGIYYKGQTRTQLHRYNATMEERGYNDEYRRNRLLRLRLNPVCQYCVLKPGANNPATTADHGTALSRGGTNDLDNLISACDECNIEKGSKSTKEYVDFIRRNYVPD